MKFKFNSSSSIVVVAGAIVVLLLGSIIYQNYAPSKYDTFAQCLADNGAHVYEAYWCSACAAQKELFGSSWRFMNTTECSTQGSRNFDLCPDIESTPTWEDADGQRFTGVQSLEQLAERFNCELPE
jgi:hypothetical protein